MGYIFEWIDLDTHNSESPKAFNGITSGVTVIAQANTGSAREMRLRVYGNRGTGFPTVEKILLVRQAGTTPPPVEGSKIYYTSTDGNIVEPVNTDWGANIVSNTYTGGQGCITFDGTIEEIPDYAFENKDTLRTIIIPDGVTSIGGYAFSGCDNLTSVSIPDEVDFMGHYAFYNSGIESINIPNGVTSIENSTFEHCTSLISVNIPDGVETIGVSAFELCFSLTGVTIPSSVTRIGDTAFSECPDLEYVKVLGTVPAELGDIVFDEAGTGTGCPIYVPCEAVSTYKAASGWSAYASRIKGKDCIGNVIYYTSTNGRKVTPYTTSSTYWGANIVSNTYSGGTGMIVFDDEIEIIPYEAFGDCTTLLTINIPDGVTTIDNSAFYGCTGVTSIDVPDSVDTIGEKAFYGCNSLESIVIPNGVTRIENQTFYWCTSITSITIPDSVTYIGEEAFRNCYELTDITIPSGVTRIESMTFNSCRSLTGITIPETVTSIGDYAFAGCRSLTSIIVPSGVTSIEDDAFRNCSSLTAVHMESTTPPKLGYDVFYNTNNCPIYVPCGYGNTYKAATGWSDYASRIEEDCPEPVSENYIRSDVSEPLNVAVLNGLNDTVIVSDVLTSSTDRITWEGNYPTIYLQISCLTDSLVVYVYDDDDPDTHYDDRINIIAGGTPAETHKLHPFDGENYHMAINYDTTALMAPAPEPEEETNENITEEENGDNQEL